MPLKVVKFIKTNGQRSDPNGVPTYTLYFDAVVEFLPSQSGARRSSSLDLGLDYIQLKMSLDIDGSKRVSSEGGTVRDSLWGGELVFRRAERGWQGPDGKVY